MAPNRGLRSRGDSWLIRPLVWLNAPFWWLDPRIRIVVGWLGILLTLAAIVLAVAELTL